MDDCCCVLSLAWLLCVMLSCLSGHGLLVQRDVWCSFEMQDGQDLENREA